MAGIADCLSAIDFSRHRAVIAAVSGGSDSTALLALASEYLKSHAPFTRLVAVTVNHGLRPQSAKEAERVAQLCRQLGVEHLTRPWTGAKPSTGVQAAAREARYDLLSEAATELGADLVLTGHTRDDQLETVLMRKERGDGPGLAGIASATLAFRDDGAKPVWFARPFLGFSRAVLREELTPLGISWIDDPSNMNTDFERVRARAKIAVLDSVSIETICADQFHTARQRRDLSLRVCSFIGKHVSKAATGLYLVNAEISQETDTEAAAGTVRTVMAFAGGSERSVDERTASELLQKISAGVPFRATASRALIDFRRQGLFVLREDRDVRQDGNIFDGRYIVRPGDGERAKTEARSDLPGSLIAQAQRLEPSQTLKITRHLLNPWPKRLPLFDVPAASALARLAGEPAFPPAPCSL